MAADDPRSAEAARLRREAIPDEAPEIARVRQALPLTRRELALGVPYLGFVAFGMLLSYFGGGREDVLPGVIGTGALIGAVSCAVKWIQAASRA